MKKLTLAIVLLVLIVASALSEPLPPEKLQLRNVDPLGVSQTLKNNSFISLVLSDECNSVYDDRVPTKGATDLKKEDASDYYAEMERILDQQECLALATCVNKCPNVRIVNFVRLKKQPGVLYFASLPDVIKVKELKVNSRVAFTTIPQGREMEHVRAIAQVKRSRKTIFDLQEAFESKIEGYEETIKTYGNTLVLFEIHFSKARVVLDWERMSTVNVTDDNKESHK